MGIIKATSTEFGNIADCVFPLNTHLNGYEGWLYLGSVEHYGEDVDLYWLQNAKERVITESDELFSIVYGNDCADYVSPFGRSSLHHYQNAGERILVAIEAIEKKQKEKTA